MTIWVSGFGPVRPGDSVYAGGLAAEGQPVQELYSGAAPGMADGIGQMDEAPIVKLVNSLIADAVRKGASDIHIEPYEKTMRVRFRIDGALQEMMAPPYKFKAAITSPWVSRARPLTGQARSTASTRPSRARKWATSGSAPTRRRVPAGGGSRRVKAAASRSSSPEAFSFSLRPRFATTRWRTRPRSSR